jgi:phosphomevalonate kinase
MQLADRAHLAFQGGQGSGADIAVAALDASIRFQREQTPTPLQLPSDLHMLAIWTGVSASTRVYLEQLARWRAAKPSACERHMARLRGVAERFFEVSGTDAVLQLIAEYDRYLNEFSQDSSLNFYNEPHIALRKEVESARCLYKPSGAGGGDFGIAFSADKNDIDNLAEAMKKQERIAFRIDRSV